MLQRNEHVPRFGSWRLNNCKILEKCDIYFQDSKNEKFLFGVISVLYDNLKYLPKLVILVLFYILK